MENIAINPALIERIARICHEVNYEYCQTIGDPATPWDEASDPIRASVRDGVEKVLSGEIRAPGDSHRNWLAFKEKEGWQYGPVKDEALKEHPCFLPFEDLPSVQRQKDVTFVAVVRGCARVFGLTIPQ